MRKVCLHPTPLKPSAASVSLSYHLLLHVLLPEGHFSQPYEQQLLRSEMEREREKKRVKNPKRSHWHFLPSTSTMCVEAERNIIEILISNSVFSSNFA